MTAVSVRERSHAMASSLVGKFGIACLFLLAVFAIPLPSRLSGGFLWGEDTAIFMRAAYETGVNSLLAPYVDYLHTLPRLLDYALAHTTAITSTPYTYVYACLLLYAASASYLYRVALRFFDGYRFAAAIAAAPFLVAQSGEVYLSVTNLQWIAAVVLLAMVWDTFTPCTARRAWSLRLAILAVLIMTGPFAVFFSPVFVLILWHNRRHLNNQQALSALAVCIVAGLIQLLTMVFSLTAAVPGHVVHGWAEFRFGYQFMHNFVFRFSLPGPC